jgi:hypothetical protein
MAQNAIVWKEVLGPKVIIMFDTDWERWEVNAPGTGTRELPFDVEEIIVAHLRFEPESGFWVLDLNAPFRVPGVRFIIKQPN